MSFSDIASFSFNYYSDIRFWISFVVVAVIFRTLSFNRNIRNLLLGLFNLILLFALPRFTPYTFLFLLSLCVLTYIFGYILNNGILVKTRGSKLWLASLSVVFVVLVLAFFKYSFIQKTFFQNVFKRTYEASDFIFIIGISYFSFKMIHFLIESYKQQIHELCLSYYLNYIFFFPAFISGPIARYDKFAVQLNAENSTALSDDLGKGLERIIHGLFKKFALSMIFYQYTLANISGSIADLSSGRIILGLYAYTLYFYFDFAGYTDMAIGCARILGYRLPENFNNPFMKKNIQELWASWHMSLTGWLTDYIYWPLSKRLRKIGYYRKRPILLSNISIITTFIICGMWHGSTLNFIIWGLYHGIGLAILNIYRKYKRKVRNRYLQRYFQSRTSASVGVFMTFNFFVLGLPLFAFEMDTIAMLVKKLFNIF